MVLLSLFSKLRCAHCSEGGVCGAVVWSGRDVIGCGPPFVSFGRAAHPCEHIGEERRVPLSSLYAETEEESLLFPFGEAGVCAALPPAGAGALYGVPLEHGAHLRIFPDHRKDVVVDGTRSVSADTRQARSMRMATAAGGFLLREVAFERREGKRPAFAILTAAGQPVEIVVPANMFQRKPVSCVHPELLLGASPPELVPSAELGKVLRGAAATGVIILKANGGRIVVDLLSGKDASAAACPDAVAIHTSVPAIVALHAANRVFRAYGRVHGAERGWRVDTAHFVEWLADELPRLSDL